MPIIRERTFSVETLEEKVVKATNSEIDQVIFNSLSFEKESLVQNLPKIFAQTCQEGQVVNDQVYFNDLQISKETIKEAPCEKVIESSGQVLDQVIFNHFGFEKESVQNTPERSCYESIIEDIG